MSSLGPESRPPWADLAAEPGSHRGSGNGNGGNGTGGDGGSGDPVRRVNGRRPPGAHRASKPDGLIPGFGRLRGRDDRDPRKMPEPYPADLPLAGGAGFRSRHQGRSAEGGAEFSPTGAPPPPPARPAGAPAPPTHGAASPRLH